MKHLKHSLLVLVMLTLLLSIAVAQPNSAAKIDEYLTRLAGYGFTGAVLVAKDGKVVLEKGYGLADRKRDVPFTKDTVFDIGSNTKDFTKLAILQLAEKKKLALNDPITKFFDNVPSDKAVITVEQLINHTAGIGMYAGRDDEKLTKEEFLQRVFSAALISEPGKRDNYSNPGYGLLAAIIEKVSGQTYEQYVAEQILKPAGMAVTGYLLPKWKAEQLAHNYEDGIERPSTLDLPHLPDGVSWSLRGAGGILSTLGDMYKFNLAVEGDQLLPKDFRPKLFSLDEPVTLVGGNGVHYFVYMREPAARLVVLISTTDAGMRATEVVTHIAALSQGKELALPPQLTKLDTAALNKVAGTYNLPSGAELNVTVNGDRLFVVGTNQEGFTLLAGSKRGNPEQVAKMNNQVRTLLEAGAKGDYAIMHQAFGAAMPYEEFKSRQEAQWKRRRERFGEFKGVKILGTVLSQGSYVTTAQMDFERGADYAQFIWGGGILRALRLAIPAPGTLFFPHSATEYVNYNLTTGETLILGFKPNADSTGFTAEVRVSSAPASPAATAKNMTGKLPDTTAGHIAAAYLKAFNSGEENVMKEFFLSYLSKASLASRPMEERLKISRQMHEDLGNLEVESVSEANEQSITVSINLKDGGEVKFRFDLDPAEPQKLKGLRVERR